MIVGILIALGILGAFIVYLVNRPASVPENANQPTEQPAVVPSPDEPFAPSVLTPKPPIPTPQPTTPPEDGDGVGGGK